MALGVQATSGDWVECFGEGELRTRRADVRRGHVFLTTVTVDEHHPMKALGSFTETGQGVVVKKSLGGFAVVELKGGRSNGTFDYRVVAERRGFEDARLEVVDGVPSAPRMNAFRPRHD